MKKESHKIKQTIRQLVWNKFIGAKNGTGYCWCCNSTVINVFEFECGHILARSKGGPDTVENLRPICGLCNRSMGAMHMLEFMKLHGLGNTSRDWGIYNMFSGMYSMIFGVTKVASIKD